MRLGIIGNCSFSALLDRGSVKWLCWPRMDSSFVFGGLLDEEKGGAFDIEGVDATEVHTEYLRNTNILRTVFTTPTGKFELIDCAPRFHLYSRNFKPTMLVRVLRPLEGEPRVRVRCRPVYDYGRRRAEAIASSNHIEYTGLGTPLRLTTNASLTYVQEELPFVLTRPHHFVLAWGQPLESGLEETAESFVDRTADYWRKWVRRSRIPRDYQDQVIRSALVLKLHQYDDTGAIIAATTTSIPEFPGSGRCWDYRFCWLRDAYFSLNALERLGHSDEMERFLNYLRNICMNHGDDLRPLYGVNGSTKADEVILDHLAGYHGDGPVRIGNQAIEQEQYDVYGEMILAVSRMLLDTRFAGTAGLEGAPELVSRLVGQMETRLECPDAGLWELRGQTAVHGFTLLTSWAGARRAAEVADFLGERELCSRAVGVQRRARELLERECWNDELQAFTQAVGRPNLDAAMLLALHFGFLQPDDPRAHTHVEAIRGRLSVDGGLLRRYDIEDDFGYQEAAFTVCSFWLAEALAIIGRTDEARELFERLLSMENGLGLFSEDIIAETGEQCGNFPQTYSHVGLINTAFRLSRDWA